MSSDAQIFELEKSIVKSIDKLNENLLMIAYQLYHSNFKGGYRIRPDETFKNFLSDKEELKQIKNQS